MPTAIKESAVQKVIERIGLIAGTPFNTDFEGRVYRARRDILDLPAVSIFPQYAASVDGNSNYWAELIDLPIRIEALSKWTESSVESLSGADAASILVESDIYEALLGKIWRLTFTGANFAPGQDETDLPGTEMPGGIGGYVISYTPDSPWVLPQNGTLDVLRVEDDTKFSAGPITIGGMTCTGVTFVEADIDISPIEKIEWIGSGIETFPDTAGDLVNTVVDIIARFRYDKGDPYSQSS